MSAAKSLAALELPPPQTKLFPAVVSYCTVCRQQSTWLQSRKDVGFSIVQSEQIHDPALNQTQALAKGLYILSAQTPSPGFQENEDDEPEPLLL